ncbi:CHY zinc finger protein [Arthrobacter rhombi]|uniref:CHY zinc finger protein n=1 Tax=Arthrobacter rhombi TaxID=71253 RepID=UPI003F8E950A
MSRPRVLGQVVDGQTRCAHYQTVLDVIAIRFHCCGEYYPCHLCHAEIPGQHEAICWPVAEYDARAVMCGVCGYELGIAEYLARTDCPCCGARFNPGCKLHADLYFAPAI